MPRPDPRRLSTRIVVLFLGLLLLVQGAVFWVLRDHVLARERAAIDQRLQTADATLQTLLAHKAERLASGARVTASEYGLRQAVGSQDGRSAEIDRATFEDALRNNLRRLCRGAGAGGGGETERCEAGARAAVFDAAGALQAATDPRHALLATVARGLRPDDDSAACPRPGGPAPGGAAAAGSPGRFVVPLDGELVQFVLVPRCNPLLAGWVLMGLAIDQGLADDLHRIAGVHLLLLARADAAGARVDVTGVAAVADATSAADAADPAGPAGAWRAPVATLSAADAADVLGALPAALPTSRLLTASGQEYGVQPLALGRGPQGQAQALLALSVDEAMAAFSALQAVLAGVTLAGVALFALGAVVTARRITTPLRALARASERLGRGELDEPVPQPAVRDEVSDLAQAMEAMRTSIRGQQQEIRELAYRDRLTGLPNRAALRKALAQALHAEAPPEATAPAPRFAVLMLGLDRFKRVNETLGYAFGDRVLRTVAQRLGGHLGRGGDRLARLSGDQFALLLAGADEARALAVAEGIRAALEQPLAIGEQVVDVAASVGIACWPAHAPAAGDPALREGGDEARSDVLVARAEMAMYTAKERAAGVFVYDPAIDAGSVQTLHLLSDLRHAIAADELRLHLQPKIDLATLRVVGAEALVRWQRGAELVPPMSFIPFAEDTGFVRQLTLWVFEAAARAWPGLQALGLMHIAVNLSTRDLLDAQLPQRLDAILRRHGVPATAFCLEITESAVMHEPKRALAMLVQLGMAGFKLAIDDYGEGQTSLSYLKRLPVHELKIDQIFVRRMDEDAKDAKIVRSTVALAHSLGFKVVAEGVESAAALALLQQMGADQAQGFHLSRPLPAAALAGFVEKWSRMHGLALPGEAPDDVAVTLQTV